MSPARLAPLAGSPALVLTPSGERAPTLIIADLHLGLGGSARWPQGTPEGSPDRLAASLIDESDRAGARRLVIAGDVKHPIVGTPPPLRPVVFSFFGRLLEAGLTPEIVLGNHDVGLTPYLPQEVTVHPAHGIVRSGVGIFHGHGWPSAEVLAQDRIVVGHLHPGFRFAPTAAEGERKRRCWVRTRLAPRVPAPKGRRSPRRFAATEAIVLPAYHPLAGTEALNRRAPTRGRSFLFSRLLMQGASRLYLLDGTDLGALTLPPAPDPPKRSRPRASRDR